MSLKAWHKRNPAKLCELIEEVTTKFTDLWHVRDTNDKVCLAGAFPIVENGKTIDRFSIRIEFPHDYPASPPIVYEIGGRIPRTRDRHLDGNGAACLFVPDERWRYWPPGATILEFLNGPVRDFFLLQLFFELTGDPISQARPHGVEGKLEYYYEELETRSLDVVIKAVQYLARKEVKGHWDCYCGSGKRLRDCHFDKIRDLRCRIAPAIASQSYHDLRGYQQNQDHERRGNSDSESRDTH